MQIHVVSRCSLTGFGRKGPAELFDETNLRVRLQAFRELTVPSMLSQRFLTTWTLYYDVQAPEWYINECRALVAHDKRVHVKAVCGMRAAIDDWATTVTSFAPGFFTARLDDDDGIGPNLFGQLITRYANVPDGHVVSFRFGRLLRLIDGRFFLASEPFDYRYYSVGLACKNGNIWACGQHQQIPVALKGRCTCDERPGAWFANVEHGTNDGINGVTRTRVRGTLRPIGNPMDVFKAAGPSTASARPA